MVSEQVSKSRADVSSHQLASSTSTRCECKQAILLNLRRSHVLVAGTKECSQYGLFQYCLISLGLDVDREVRRERFSVIFLSFWHILPVKGGTRSFVNEGNATEPSPREDTVAG